MAAVPSPHTQFSETHPPKISEVGGRRTQAPPAPSSQGILLPISSFLGYDDWEFELALRQIGGRIRPQPPSPSPEGAKHARVDASHPGLLQTHWPFPKHPSFQAGTSRPKRYLPLFFYGGIVLFTCGLALLVWGYLGGRPDLPRWGWLCMLLGQAGLLLKSYFFFSRR